MFRSPGTHTHDTLDTIKSHVVIQFGGNEAHGSPEYSLVAV